ncbi:MFS transporter, partial [Pseudoalteromonas sp. 19-MNA-CIBAN-0066]
FLANTAGGSTALFWLDFETWRWMFWVELLPACLFLIALFFIPESPRYLIMAGKKEAAARVLSSLYGDETAASKLNEIVESLAADKHQPKLSD